MFLWPCSLLFLDRTFLSPVSGFPWVFHEFFFSAPLLSFLPLGCSCLVRVLCVPYSSLLYMLLVTLSFSVSNGYFFILYRFSGSLPRPTFVSLVSFLFFSCLVFLFCALSLGPPGLQLRLRRRRVILLHFPLLWLLPLRLLSGFHLLLPFSGTLLLLAGFRCGLLVSAR